MVNKMDEYFEGKVKEVQSAEDASYFLENNEIFYDIGFKVMQNQENVNLLECHRLKYNGKIKLVYFTRDYTSMADYIASSDVDTILSLIDSLIRALIQIENLGFLNMACIDNRLSHMYVEPNTNTISINDLKSEWDTKEAQKVYDMVDDDWQEGVNATVEALGDLAEAIKGAKAKYAEIEINAKNNLVFNKM